MDQICQNRTSLHIAPPRSAVIIIVLSGCPLACYPHQFADAPLCNDFTCLCRTGVIAPLMPNQNVTALLLGKTGHFISFCKGGSNWFFDQNGLPGFKRHHHVLMMTLCWRRDDYRIKTALRQHRAGFGVNGNILRRSNPDRRWRGVRYRDKRDLRHLLHRLHMPDTDRASAYQTNPDLVHQVSPSTSLNNISSITRGTLPICGVNPIWSRISLSRSTPGAISIRLTPSLVSSKTARSVT